jgi:CO/xanthine dehydrogenase Mo-binding subunit
MHFVRTIRSPIRSGKLLSVDCPVLPEGYCLIRAADIPGQNYLAVPNADFPPEFSHPILAESKLLYEGQPVALLVGPDLAEIAKFEAAILVNAEAADAEEGEGAADAPVRVYAERNITIEPKAGRSCQADVPPPQTRIVESHLRTPCAEHNAPECTGAVAFFEGGRCVVHTASQWPRHVQRSIAGSLNINAADIVIGRESPGVHFDAKVWYPSLVAVQAALAASITKKAVKFMLSREEERLYSPRRATSDIRFRSVIDENGGILETVIDIKADLGACGFFADEIIDRMALASLGLYRLGTVSIHARAVGTASIPKGAFSGFGLAQGFFAVERHVTRVTNELGVSPLHWKLERNIVRQGGAPVKLPIGITLKKPLPFQAVISTVSAQSDFGRKWAAYDLVHRQSKVEGDGILPIRGIGLTVAYQGAGLLYHTGKDPLPPVTAVIEDDELLVKCASSKEVGSNIALWKELALNAAPHVKSVRYDDGGSDWGDDPAVLSRDTAYITGLVEQAAQSASLLPVVPVPDSFNTQASQSVARYQGKEVQSWSGKTCDAKAFAHPSLCAAVVEVEIDRIEYKPVIRGVWLCVEGGKILSIHEACNTLTISGIAALAWAQGKREVPNIKDVPHIAIDFIPSDDGCITGMEELAFSTIPAAYAAAVSQAINIPFDRLPIRTLEIWQALNPTPEQDDKSEKGEKGGEE